MRRFGRPFLYAALPAMALAGCSPVAEDDANQGTGAATDETPATTPPPAAPKPFDTASWVRENMGQDGPVMYRDGRADLDGDGIDEIFVYTGGAMLCGSGGCPLTVLRITPEGPQKIVQTTVTQLPVGILDTSTNGMRDIWVSVSGGGATAQTRKLSFDGTSYPKNPTVEPAETIGKRGAVVIEAGELTPLTDK